MSSLWKAQKSAEQPRPTKSRITACRDNSNQRVAQNFDRDAADYANAYQELDAAFFFRRRQAIVMQFLQPLDGGMILDVGCGPAVYAQPCVDQGFHYHGLDISSQMIREGLRRFGNLPNVELTAGDARHLPFSSGSVDGVLCLGMLEYVSREHEAAYLNEMVRVLKPGGTMILSFLNASSPSWMWVDHFLPSVKFLVKNVKAVLKNSEWVSFTNCLGEDLPTRKFRLAERTRILQATGLSVVGTVYFCLNVFPSPLDARFPRQSFRVSSRLEPLLGIPVLKDLGMGFVIAARKSIAAGGSEQITVWRP